MVGLVMLAVRSASPPSLIPETFGPSRIHVPKAPGLGLLLISPHYTEYNKRITEANSKLDELLAAGRIDDKAYGEQKRDAIDFVSLGLKDRIDEFKQEQVYKRMWSVEQDDLVFSKWLNFLDTFVGNDFESVIPPSSSAVYICLEASRRRRYA
jgi:tRNA pseudouridine38-40 synthase